MNNLYDRKKLQIQHQLAEEEQELKSQKYYTRLDIEELEQRWIMKCCLCIGVTTVVITLLISILHR